MGDRPKNYFLVNRSLINSDRWLDEPFTRGQAWVDLIGLAQHTSGHFRVRGIKVKLKRSQLGYSQVTLAKRWKWSREKVRRYLKELEDEQDIVQQNSGVTTVITIKKYNYWQGCDTTNQTAEKQQKNSKRDTYNKDNNINNITGNNLKKQSTDLSTGHEAMIRTSGGMVPLNKYLEN